MEITLEQKLNSQVVQKAWEDKQYMNELIANPVEAIEKLTGHKISLPKGQKLVVVDQSDASTVYFNVPRKLDINSLELTEEQLEQVAGGVLPLILYGVCVGIAIYAASHQ
ncbi:class IIb bacteriocin, lactobin A/cerein 7B family [Flavobacterium flavigenum]|uniref:class IIb bacteriocin, lactobin A/cerein 7B family n=1 Tax=Flavobacterium flavigenum TaxID=3003258 RepID=UPI0022AC285F|nr:class IIb bacteriocin, lactobin A/cerein 7B family [Flavobacterium flavigenum]